MLYRLPLLPRAAFFAMHRWLRLARGIDRFIGLVGRAVYWLTLAMVLVGAYNALARYTDRMTGLGLSSNTYIELQWYLFSLVFLLGAAYTLREDAHVRVDVLYERLSGKGKAWVNLLGALFLLLPFCALMLWASWSFVEHSWALLEESPDPGGLPRYPIKTAIPAAFVLLAVQAVALVIRQMAVLHDIVPEEPPSDQRVSDLGEGT